MEIRLNDKHTIGDYKKPFVVAEVGSNWQSLEDCFLSVRAAKDSGADAVKFQLFDELALYGYSPAKLEAARYGYALDLSKISNLCHWLDPDWLPAIKEECDKYNIEFMCSAFSPALADIVNPLVCVHKVASSEMYHRRLLERLNSFGKPVFLSTAAATLPDIDAALKCLKDVPVVVMYCVGAYPAREVDFNVMGMLRHNTGRLIGYSDHTTDIRVVPTFAAMNGACVIEKHFTAISAKTPDFEHSLNADEFKTMVACIHDKPLKIVYGPQKAESEMVLKHKRRLKIIAPVRMGEELIEEKNFGIYRSLSDDVRALSPFSIDEVIGKKATRDLKVGDGLGPGDFE